MDVSSDITFTTPTLHISPIRISTVVTTCHVDSIIHLESLWEQVPIMPYWHLNDGILKMGYKGETKGTSWKDILQAPEKGKTFFFNQATIVIRLEVAPLQWKEINIKLFRNGGIQMTGVRSEKMSQDAIEWLLRHLSSCTKPVFETPTRIHKMQIQLVNTDFSIGAKIRRDALYKLLNEKYHLSVSYEPSIYQGVKTKYFFNENRASTCPPGICGCGEKLCKGTGDGASLGACKKITISPFQTGQVIITGARTMNQINEAYEFMKDVFQTNADDILRKTYICPEVLPEEPVAKKQTGWIHHPSPRNVFHIDVDKVVV